MTAAAVRSAILHLGETTAAGALRVIRRHVRLGLTEGLAVA